MLETFNFHSLKKLLSFFINSTIMSVAFWFVNFEMETIVPTRLDALNIMDG